MKSFLRSIPIVRRRCIAACLLPVMLIGFCLTAPGNAAAPCPPSPSHLTLRAAMNETSRLFASTSPRWNGGCETGDFHSRPLANPLCSAALAQARSPHRIQSFTQSVVTRRQSAPPPPLGRSVIFLRAPPTR
ncbi:MAG: hypothetical protein ACYC26_04055 [Phycisphaerales bacterium]